MDIFFFILHFIISFPENGLKIKRYFLPIGRNKIVHQENKNILDEILVSLFSYSLNPFFVPGENKSQNTVLIAMQAFMCMQGKKSISPWYTPLQQMISIACKNE